MLRATVIALSALLLVGGVIATIADRGAIGVAVAGAVILAASLFEAGRYRARARAQDGWTDTDERFVDPTSGKLMLVRFNPRTGERQYVEAPPPP